MKIMEIIPHLSKRAGAEVFSYSLAKAFLRRGDIELSYVCFYDEIHPSFNDLREMLGGSFYTLGKHKGIDLRTASRLSGLIKRIKPDIIHTNLTVATTYVLSRGLFKKTPPLIHTVHNLADKEGGSAIDLKLKILLNRLGSARLVGISKNISDSIQDVYGKPPIATIYNGIDFGNGSVLERNKHFSYDFICVARFEEQKNHKLLIRSFSEVLKKHPDARLLLCGDGTLINPCKQLASDLNLGESVIFAGAVANIPELLSQSRSFVLSSNYEGNPISILEALHAGVPVIAPNVGGIPDVIQDGSVGRLFEVGDEKSLINLMNESIENPDFSKMTNQCFEYSKKYDINKCANQYVEVFREALKPVN